MQLKMARLCHVANQNASASNTSMYQSVSFNPPFYNCNPSPHQMAHLLSNAAANIYTPNTMLTEPKHAPNQVALVPSFTLQCHALAKNYGKST